MARINTAPVTYPMINKDGTISKGWLDWVLEYDAVHKGSYDYKNVGYNVTPHKVDLNLQLAISNSSYTVPVPVQDGVVSVDNFSDSDAHLSGSQVMVRDSVISLPAATEGYYMISGTLIRR